MNYLAQGLTQGFQVGADAYHAKKRRQFEKEQADELKQLRQKQLDFEISNADRTFNRQTGRDQVADIQADRGFAFQVTAKEDDDAYRGGRAKASDSQFDRSMQQRAGEFAITDLRGAQDSAQRMLDNDAKMQLAERQLQADIAQSKDRNALTGRSIDVQERIGGARYPSFNGGEGLAMFGAEYEGKIVQGPDGKKYLIQNGVPIPQ